LPEFAVLSFLLSATAMRFFESAGERQTTDARVFQSSGGPSAASASAIRNANAPTQSGPSIGP
jgi:hypothetical protein